MAKYTIAIREILESSGNANLMDLPALLVTVKSTIFGPELQYLDVATQDKFALGFALHYFNDEIGMETLPMWRMAVMEKVINNAERINLIYSNLDKQLYSDYTVRNVVKDGLLTNNSDRTSSETMSTAGTHGSKSDTATAANGSTTGSATSAENNNNTSTNSGTVIDSASGTHTNNTLTTGSDGSEVLFSDTPQGKLANVRSAEYLSSATIGTQSKNTNVADTGSDTNGNTRTDTMANTSVGSGSGTSSSLGSSTDAATIGNVASGTNSLTGNKNGTKVGIDTSTDHSSMTATSYTLSYEMIMKSESMLIKVWEIMDNLFMQIH